MFNALHTVADTFQLSYFFGMHSKALKDVHILHVEKAPFDKSLHMYMNYLFPEPNWNAEESINYHVYSQLKSYCIGDGEMVRIP